MSLYFHMLRSVAKSRAYARFPSDPQQFELLFLYFLLLVTNPVAGFWLVYFPFFSSIFLVNSVSRVCLVRWTAALRVSSLTHPFRYYFRSPMTFIRHYFTARVCLVSCVLGYYSTHPICARVFAWCLRLWSRLSFLPLLFKTLVRSVASLFVSGGSYSAAFWHNSFVSVPSVSCSFR